MGSEFEAIVVGAAPAGSMAAYELAGAGVRVLLLERELLPRYKACGGGLTAKAVRQIGFDLSPVVEDVCHGFAETFRQAGQFVRRYYRPMVYAATARTQSRGRITYSKFTLEDRNDRPSHGHAQQAERH